ncbi:hypothetical protein [Streptomyces sp. L-9-10]|uniref:hypothetical protein n=1 Tax=Streptomyces sp. L-9-10 TaxID=1478131 RepID=UPI00101D9F7E|nr:hypothetical protein [Streptomyces sp. L-9-10]
MQHLDDERLRPAKGSPGTLAVTALEMAVDTERIHHHGRRAPAAYDATPAVCLAQPARRVLTPSASKS